MKQIADDVWQLAGFPRDMFNVYLAGDMLIDAGTRWAKSRIFRQLGRRKLSVMALTHVHPDHQGAARAVCERYHVPLACHEADVPAMEGRGAMGPRNWILKLGDIFWAGPPCRVEHVLHDGDHIGEFRVVHTPGHTPGHVVYFRERDGLAIAGDVLANMNFLTRKAGLIEPPSYFSVDRGLNRKSILLLRDLKPAMVCFGHGPPLVEPALLDRFAQRFEVSHFANRGVQSDGGIDYDTHQTVTSGSAKENA
jgi:glyoxylase-like metal-dependent hydrolase (beta-lactamase superfamily II)